MSSNLDRVYKEVLIGPKRCLHCNCEHGSCATADAADRLLDGITMALQEFDTETLLAIADYRDRIERSASTVPGWMGKLIRQYVEVWR